MDLYTGPISSGTACLICDANSKNILHVSRAITILTGIDEAELRALKVGDLFPDQSAELEKLAKVPSGHEHAQTAQLSIVQQQADLKLVEVVISKFQFGDSSLLLLQIFDPEQIKAWQGHTNLFRLPPDTLPSEENVDGIFRNLERGNRLILDAAGEGIYGVDADGKTTFVNPAAENMLGWKAEELVGELMHSVVHHSYEDGSHYPHQYCPIYAAFQDGAVHRVDHEVFWRKDGTPFAVEYTSTPILHGREAIGAVIIFRDISERRKTEQSLKTALEEVEKLKKRLELENAYLQAELSEETKHGEIVGTSSVVNRILRQIELVAPTDANVLITGESGTGKQLIARAIHRASSRKSRPMVRVNCAAIPRETFESEFFGHKKGAFTGAISERVGRFELADGGTLFLDDVGALPQEQQAKLLRVLTEHEFERLGDTKTTKVDVRIIAASNENLERKVQNKTFREDLFFRLSVFPIDSPPLRERLEDIPHLATHFVNQSCNRLNMPAKSVSLADIERLKTYSWPGNIIEFENVIERAVIVSEDHKLRFDLPVSDAHQGVSQKNYATGKNAILTESEIIASEKENILSALKRTGGKVAGRDGAAELLGLKPTTLYSRLKRYGINARDLKG